MKTKYLYLLVALALSSCGINKLATSNLYEDDIYYNPSERSLAVKEVEKNLNIYNQDENKVSQVKSNSYKETATNIIKNNRRQYPDITNSDLRDINIASISLRENASTGVSDTIIEILNNGFWINDFTGTDYNLDEAMRTIDRFPNGFGYDNMYTSERANTLAFSPDWNVFTRDGRYWWFPVYGSASSSQYPHLRKINAWNYGNYDYLSFGIRSRRFYAYNMYGHRSSFYGDFWGDDYLYQNYYGYGYNNPYLYGNRYHDYYGYGQYNGYGYGYNGYNRYNGYNYNTYTRSANLRRERGVTNVRATRSSMRLNNNGRTYQRVTRSNTNLRRSSFNKNGTSKVNTNYKRKKINYSRQTNSTRPSYNSSAIRNNSSSSNNNSTSSSSSSSSSSNNSSSGQVRRR